jgi:hypothetical protein
MNKFKELYESKEDQMYAREIADKTGLNKLFLQDWMEDNSIDPYELMQAVGQKKIKPIDLATAVSGKPNNAYTKKIAKLVNKGK